MFGFGKKKLDDRMARFFLMEVGMFQSWTLDNRKIDLSPEILEDIIKRILDREKFSYTSEESTGLKFMAMSNTDFVQLRKFRSDTNFDSQIIGFCRSINLPVGFYTPLR